MGLSLRSAFHPMSMYRCSGDPSIIGKEQLAEAGRPDMTPKKSQPDASNSSIGEAVVGEMLIDQILGFAL